MSAFSESALFFRSGRLTSEDAAGYTHQRRFFKLALSGYQDLVKEIGNYARVRTSFQLGMSTFSQGLKLHGGTMD